MGRLAAWRLAADDVTVVADDVDEVALGRAAHHVPQLIPTVLDVRDADAVAGVRDHLKSEADLDVPEDLLLGLYRFRVLVTPDQAAVIAGQGAS